MLQETHFLEKYESKYNLNWKGKSFHAFSDSTFSKGVSKEKLNTKITNVRKSNDGRRILINLELDGNVFTIVNIYAHNNVSAGCEVFKKLNYFLSKYRMNENIIICGDFNCKTNNLADKSVRYLKDLIDHFNLDDMWEKLNPEMAGFIWCDAKNDPKSRIDNVFINTSFHYELTRVKVGKIPGTHSNGNRMRDHRFLKFLYDIDKTKRGPGCWKLNASYLENEITKKELYST